MGRKSQLNYSAPDVSTRSGADFFETPAIYTEFMTGSIRRSFNNLRLDFSSRKMCYRLFSFI